MRRRVQASLFSEPAVPQPLFTAFAPLLPVNPGADHNGASGPEGSAGCRESSTHVTPAEPSEPSRSSAIIFEVPGEPQGKGRHRSFIRGGKIASYTPDKTASFEGKIGYLARQAIAGGSPFGDHVELQLELIVGFSIPASWSNRKRAEALAGRVRPTRKPDADNIGKIFADSLNAVLYRDDAQIVDLIVRKVYAQMPSTQVRLRPATWGLA